MSEVFLKIVNMSISASWIVLAVLVLRLLMKKAPKWINVLLWGIVGIRLICPFSIESMLSLIPSGETIPTDIMTKPSPNINSGIAFVDTTVNRYLSDRYMEGVTVPTDYGKIIITALSVIWLIGIAVMLVYTAVSYIKIKRKVNEAVSEGGNIRLCDRIEAPFILGIFKPEIYLPFSLKRQAAELVIAHEKAHILRRDYLWKPLGFLILTLHWFNPVMWLGYVLLCRDIELACDERVVKELSDGQRADYSEVLLSCSVNRRIIRVCPLAFGEVGVKERVKGVLGYKKPAFGIVALSVIAVSAAAVCLLTSPNGQSLQNIEGMDLASYQQNTVSLLTYDGKSYEGISVFDEDLLYELVTVRISKKEVSNKPIEKRDDTHTLVLQNEYDIVPTIHSYMSGLHVCFNKDFKEVWINRLSDDGVGITYTACYEVQNPKKAKKIYNDLCNYVGADKDKTVTEELGSEDKQQIIPSYEIIDKTVIEQITCPQAFEEFYRDENYVYGFSSTKTEYIEVHYSNGEKENIKNALKKGKIKINDLNLFNIDYLKKAVGDVETDSSILINTTVAYSKEKAIEIAFAEAQRQKDEHELIIPDSAKSENTVELKSHADGSAYYAVVFRHLSRQDGGGISAIGIDVDANSGKILAVHRYK